MHVYVQETPYGWNPFQINIKNTYYWLSFWAKVNLAHYCALLWSQVLCKLTLATDQAKMASVAAKSIAWPWFLSLFRVSWFLSSFSVQFCVSFRRKPRWPAWWMIINSKRTQHDRRLQTNAPEQCHMPYTQPSDSAPSWCYSSHVESHAQHALSLLCMLKIPFPPLNKT